MTYTRAFLAEAVATFSLVFIGAGAVVANNFTNGGLGIVGIALAHGLVLMAMIYATMKVSGAHINPAVTIAMIATRNIKLTTGIGYIIAQLIGAGIAGFMLLAIFPNALAVNVGVTDISGISVASAILLEAVLTFFLVTTIFGVAVAGGREAEHYAGLAIGLVLTFDILVGGALTGAAMNPARAFGPAVAAQYWATQYVYWIGPIVGALIAAFLYKYGIMKK